MDLIGSEARKTGTRGGRASFTWDAVSAEERHYYLGNSVCVASSSRGGDPQWYAKPVASVGARPSRSHTDDAEADVETEADAVRRREKAIVDQVLVGRSFSDAVRSALADTVEGEGEAEQVEDSGAARTAAKRRRDRAEKAQRKEHRRRARELRRVRRADRQRRRERDQEGGLVVGSVRRDSTESERESARCRWNDEVSRRRRRMRRPAACRRKRNEWSDTSDSQESDDRRSVRRQRLR